MNTQPVLLLRVIERFFSKINTLSPDKCWEYKGPFLGKYGDLELGDKRFRELAHRFSYRYFNDLDEIPKGKMVCHKCDNPPCCNPEHLFLGTGKDNAQDASKKGRLKKSEKAIKRCKEVAATIPRNIFGQMIKKDDDPNVYKGVKNEELRLAKSKANIPRGENHYTARRKLNG
jgi:hypothetical protein